MTRRRQLEGPYAYVRQTYKVEPKIGAVVRHTVTHGWGVVAKEDSSMGHYVMVKFDRDKLAKPCHPLELQYFDKDPRTLMAG